MFVSFNHHLPIHKIEQKNLNHGSLPECNLPSTRLHNLINCGYFVLNFLVDYFVT